MQELRQAHNGLWQMCGSLRGSRTVAKAEEALPQPRAHVCYGGDGSKECPILLDSPLWVKDHKDMKKLLTLWVD